MTAAAPDDPRAGDGDGEEDDPSSLPTLENAPHDFDDDAAERRRFEVNRDLRTRVDRYLQNRIKGISRSRIQKLIDWGGVTINGEVPKASQRLLEGDVIDVILPPPAIREIKADPIPLHILYEDEDLLVVNKQADLIVHPARGHTSGTLVNGLAYYFQEKAGADVTEGTKALSDVGRDDQRPGIVHRLDRHTTGVMVVAKRDEAHWGIARQFEERKVLKVYLALVHGNVEPSGGVIEQPLGPHPTMREAHAVRHDPRAKRSVTLYRVREQYEGYSLVELELKTGRTHQIRVHLSWMGFPIVGDIMYGGEPVGEKELEAPPTAAGARRMLTFARDRADGTRIESQAEARDDIIMTTPALHATRLGFRHPTRNERVEFQAPLHEPMATLVRRLRERPVDKPVAKSGCWIDLDKLIGPGG